MQRVHGSNVDTRTCIKIPLHFAAGFSDPGQFACGGADRAVTLLDTRAERKVLHVPVGTVVLSVSWCAGAESAAGSAMGDS